jgi:Trk K+ transport system NAD-binding subunit
VAVTARGDDPPEPTAEPVREGSPAEGHVIICGGNALAARMAEELTVRYGLAVTAIVPAIQSVHAARLAACSGVRVIERAELTAEAFLAADLPEARSVAIVHQDDLGNFHAALRAQELNPAVRLVIAIFNEQLGERIDAFFTNCIALSQSQLAAPSVVAAALGKPTFSRVVMANQTLYVGSRADVGADRVLCGVAASEDAEAPQLLPPGDTRAGQVLAVAAGTPRNPLSRRRQRRLTAPFRWLRRIFWSKFGIAFAVVVAVLGVGFVLQATIEGLSLTNVVYLTFLDAAGDAVTDTQLPAAEKIAQFVLTVDGLAVLPLVTAAVVSARLRGSQEPDGPPPSGHVIVAGLGNIGTTIIQQLHDLGFDVVGIDKNPDARGVPLAGRLGIRVITGEAHREETLTEAGIASCRAVVSVTSDEIVNLQTALAARFLATEARIVVRLYDDDLVESLQRTYQMSGNIVSRSTSYLAAPAFAAAVLDHQVRSAIAVGRHVLLLAEVAAGSEAGLAGLPVSAVHRPGLLRVIALRGAGNDEPAWSPEPERIIGAGDVVVVLATRTGLSGLVRGAARLNTGVPGGTAADRSPRK